MSLRMFGSKGLMRSCRASGTLIVPVAGGQWSAQVPLLPNQRNPIAVRAFAPGGLFTAPILTAVAQDTTGPELQVDFPADGSTSFAQTIVIFVVQTHAHAAELIQPPAGGFRNVQPRKSGRSLHANQGACCAQQR